MKKNIIVISTVAVLIILAGCVSSPKKDTVASTEQYKASDVKIEANKIYLRDWSGRSLGTESRPVWLMEAFQNSYDKARAKFGISNEDIVKVSMVSASDIRGAQMYADMNYARLVATELQRNICVTAAEKVRNGDISEKTRQAIEEVTTSQSQVEISGHEKKVEFYHIVDEEDAVSSKVTRKCIVYQVYVIPEKTWARTCAFYLKKILGDIPEDLTPEQQKDLAQQELLKIVQEGMTDRTKITAEAKMKQVETIADAKTAAYLSGNKVVQNAVFTTPEDANRIEAEELAMSILFQ